ncbi:glycosyltransferase, group 1 [Candidatus Symbiothrix dinenymphae]|nr:glycosyltransferase, group 1 [Candidatus Symbiothrix dinenymphae]
MNICFFIHNPSSHGGTERISIALANALSKLPDYQVSMLSLEAFDATFFPVSNQVKTASLSICNANIQKNYFKAVTRLRRYVTTNKIDIIIDIDVILSAISLAATAFTKAQVISWEAYNYYTKNESIVRRFARKIAAHYSKTIITQTNQDIQFYKNNCNVKANLVAILNPVEHFPSNTSSNLQKIVLSVGHLEHRKGFDLLLDSWNKIAPAIRKDWKLQIIGKGEEKANLEASIEEDKTEDSIEILPPTNQIEEHYAKASIYAMASRAEGLPMVLIEAQSYGIPSIAFDCKTGPSDIINEGQTGFLIPCFDTDLYAEKLATLMQDSELRQQMSRHALQARHRFAIDKVIEKWVEVLNFIQN